MTKAELGGPHGPARFPARRPTDAGPPLPLVAGVTLGLVVASVVVPVVLAGGATYPTPDVSPAEVARYVAAHGDALRFAAFFQLAASLPLGVLTASTVARLHALGVRAAGPTIALVGGGLASTALAVSATGQWALSRSVGSPDLQAGLRDLVFLAGGPWHVAGLGLLLAGLAVPTAFYRLLPSTLWVTGIVLAGVCELATLTLIVPAAAYAVPVGRFLGLVWLLVACALLPRRRPRRASAGEDE